MTNTLAEYYEQSKKEHIYNIQKRNRMTWEDAEDICQDAFLKAHSKFHNYDASKGPIGGWFFWILRKAVSDFRKNKERQQDLTVVDGSDDFEFPNLVELTEGHKHKDILVSYYDGEPMDDIVKRSGLSEGYIRVIISRFQKELRNE